MGRSLGAVSAALVFLASFAAPASAGTPNTWTALGPSAAQVLDLAASPAAPDLVYAVVNSRVWKSADAGQSWTVTSPGPTQSAPSIVVDPDDGNAVVAAATNCSVWVSSDGGANWAEPLTGLNGGFCEPLLAWSPSGLFALGEGTLWASDDGGLTWSVAGTPPNGELALTFVVLPTTPATIYVGTEPGSVQLSTDGGATWSERSAGLPTSVPELPYRPGIYNLAVDPADNSVLYAQVDSVGIYRTSNGGTLWEPVEAAYTDAPPATFPVALATTPTTLVVAAGTNAYRSTNGGASWLPATKPPGGIGSGVATGFHADPSNANALYMSAFGVYRSLDAGVTFGYSGNGLDKATVHSLAPVSGMPGSYLAATEGIGVQRTDDDGESWQVVNDGVIGQTLELAAHPSDSDLFFLQAGGHLWKTTNGGGHWDTSDAGIPYGASAVAIDPSSPSKVYTAVNASVYRSTDEGATWTGSTVPAPGGTVRRLAVDPTDGNRVYAGTNSALYRSTDAGATWTRIHTSYVYDVHVARDGDVFAAVDPAVIRFDATSSTPAPASTGLADTVRGLAEDPLDPETLYADTIHGVYQSVDGGRRWAKLTTAGLDSELITYITSIAPNHLMVGTARGTASIDLIPPAATAAQADEITTSSVRLSGSGNPLGSSATAFFEYGLTPDYGSTTPTTSLGSGGDPVSLIANVTGLSPGTTYHYRLVVQSGGGIAATGDATFTTAGTPIPPPTASTGGSHTLTSSGATVSGIVNPNGAATSYWFQYGTTTSYGGQTSSASAGSGLAGVAVEAQLTGLSPATTYHYRLVAQNPGGTSFGGDREFTTASAPIPPPAPGPAPVALTSAALFVTSSEARVTGNVDPNGGSTSYWFQYGTTTAYGLQTPSASAGAGLVAVVVDSPLTGLSPATTYHFRLVAQNSGGTSVGSDREFRTASIPATVGAVSAPTLRSGRLADGAVPLSLAWSATPGSGAMCRYEVQKGSDAAPPNHVGVVEAPALFTSSQRASGLYYRVRALGCDGTVSAFADSAPVDLRLLQESTSALRRGAGWRRSAAADASGGYVLRTTSPGARITLSFTGRSLAIVVPKGPGYGAVAVSLDGAAATRIGLNSARRAPQLALYVVNFPSSGRHKVVIRARAVGSRRRVDIDAFAVVG